MKKCTIFLLLNMALLFLSAYAMDKEIEEKTLISKSNNPSVNEILHVNDPIKFEALVKILADKHNFAIQEDVGLTENLSNKGKKLASLQESISTLSLVNRGILTELKKLTQQAVNPLNKESLKGFGKTFMWAACTGTLLGAEVYLYLSNFSPDLKIAAGVPITVGIFGSFARFFENADKTIGNTHINEKIENYLSKTIFIQETKKYLLKDIENLEKEIEQQKKTFPSSELEEIAIDE